MTTPKTLFIGLGATPLAWYRAFLPALYLGQDWIGVGDKPPKLRFMTGLVGGKTAVPNYLDYEVIVVQQPRGRGWLKLIRGLQERGVKVVVEIDDYVQAIRRMEDHDFRQNFSKDDLADLELNMRAADGLIVSTEFLARRYRKFNTNVWLCENGLDTARYRLTRPPRDTVNVGWAGGTGHINAAIPWLRVLPTLMAKHDHTTFVSIGQNFADALKERWPTRAISIPWTMIETYPGAMTMFDIALAPAGRSNFFRGKSDLRWIEAGALGIPVIADPTVYPKIENGVTGFHASSPAEVYELLNVLVTDEDLRRRVGDAARQYVLDERDMTVASGQWATALQHAVAGVD